MKVFFPKGEEEIIDFINRCNIKDSEVMSCPCCRAVFDKEVAKELEKNQPLSFKERWSTRQTKRVFLLQEGVPQKTQKTSTYVLLSNYRSWCEIFIPQKLITI